MNLDQEVIKVADRETHGRTLTMFLWEQVTPSVRAGMRLKAAREREFHYISEPMPVDKREVWDHVDLEFLNNAGGHVVLWTAPFFRHINKGDRIGFTLRPE